MKIYHIRIRNNKFTGEVFRNLDIVARSVSEAVQKAKTHIEDPKVDDFYGVKNWEITSCELIAETI